MDLTAGDAFEVRYADWIRQHLPHYEKVWAAFIGHDGSGHPCAMPSLPAGLKRDLRRFCQAHYSFVPKMLEVHEIAARLDTEFTSVKVDDLHEAMRELFHLMAAIGHVRDMFIAMHESLGNRLTKIEQLKELYAKRNHVIHGPRLPILAKDGMAQIPRIAGCNPTAADWTDDSAWSDIGSMDLVFIADFAREVRDEAFRVVNAVHGCVFSAAEEHFGGARIVRACAGSENSAALSGTTMEQRATVSHGSVDGIPQLQTDGSGHRYVEIATIPEEGARLTYIPSGKRGYITEAAVRIQIRAATGRLRPGPEIPLSCVQAFRLALELLLS